MHQVYCFVLANCPHCAGLSVDKLEWTGEKITLTRFCLDNGEARPDPIKSRYIKRLDHSARRDLFQHQWRIDADCRCTHRHSRQ